MKREARCEARFYGTTIRCPHAAKHSHLGAKLCALHLRMMQRRDKQA